MSASLRLKSSFLLAVVALVSVPLGASKAVRAAEPAAAGQWQEGRNYFLVVPAQRTNLPPGKVQVTEVFSYGCPFCNNYAPFFAQLKAAMPANVVFDYLPAAFSDAEDWPMYQRAFCTAQLLGVAERVHDDIFKAVWKSGEIGYVDPVTKQPKKNLPTIEDAAKVYNKLAGVPVDKFLATAKSFAVDVKIKADNALVLAYHVDQTPTVIVNGKYRITLGSAGGTDQLISIVQSLVAKESAVK